MDEDEFEDYDREVELALYREYRDVVGQFKYVVETERRFYLANEVNLERHDTENDFYFELTMNDVWVWDVYRSDRFVKSVRVLTFKDVNVEVRGDKDLELPEGTRARRVALPVEYASAFETAGRVARSACRDPSDMSSWPTAATGTAFRSNRRASTRRCRATPSSWS